jgi:hypothetical protein
MPGPMRARRQGRGGRLKDALASAGLAEVLLYRAGEANADKGASWGPICTRVEHGARMPRWKTDCELRRDAVPC